MRVFFRVEQKICGILFVLALTEQLEKQRDELGQQVLIKESLMHEYDQKTEAVRKQFDENVKKIM